MYSKASEHVYKTAVKLILQISIQLTLYEKNLQTPLIHL